MCQRSYHIKYSLIFICVFSLSVHPFPACHERLIATALFRLERYIFFLFYFECILHGICSDSGRRIFYYTLIWELLRPANVIMCECQSSLCIFYQHMISWMGHIFPPILFIQREYKKKIRRIVRCFYVPRILCAYAELFMDYVFSHPRYWLGMH